MICLVTLDVSVAVLNAQKSVLYSIHYTAVVCACFNWVFILEHRKECIYFDLVLASLFESQLELIRNTVNYSCLILLSIQILSII